MILSWTLENLPSELPMGGERSYTVNPGEVYPAGYIGSKYSLRKIKGKYSLSLKSYSGNHVEAKNYLKIYFQHCQLLQVIIQAQLGLDGMVTLYLLHKKKMIQQFISVK